MQGVGLYAVLRDLFGIAMLRPQPFILMRQHDAALLLPKKKRKKKKRYPALRPVCVWPA